ncbi:TetR/AcrR family transcriptional regulator [Salirhabdus salicampi]|uniref:TetR/AcrR family transcriptional regulator n=1 Tax=Salirhabdus salicampi TaxID=476102 RepID=UPI0020C2B3FE|nr:TetR/AcrR family transcriptional regulator [Salirhabdus salicampi]MCP8617407.1 TetR/AcrR family transcriptional regulator [Salirhabdus salicampi]
MVKKVHSSIKDEVLIEKRRNQMIKGAVTLFKEKGFHRTTTREIAKASGFSIGTLYEYIRTKEDILFLVCDAIYEQVKDKLEQVINTKLKGEQSLTHAVKSYFQLMDDMQDEVIVMYQELKSLSKEAQDYVLCKERDMVNMLERLIESVIPYEMNEKEVKLVANNIFVQGQMWGFRRWMLQRDFSIEEYSETQLSFLFQSLRLEQDMAK